MARNTEESILSKLTKRQASAINKGNRTISGNINALSDNLHNMTYGIQRNDKINSLVDEFNELLKTELDSIGKTTDGDTTSFINKLFSENNKRVANTIKNLEDICGTDEGQLEAFLTDKYKNRLIKQADLHEVSSQLVELQEAIIITRDAIIAADVIDGHMSRTLIIDDEDGDDTEDYRPIIEKMEKRFQLQKKIKNFIVPKTLEYGEYFVYCIPYAKLFEDFMKEKNGLRSGVRHTYEHTITESITVFESMSHEEFGKLKDSITLSILDSQGNNEDKITTKKNIANELEQYLKNITVCNKPIPIPFLEEGLESSREYFHEFVEDVITEDQNTISFDKVMKSIDTGVIDAGGGRKKSGKSKKESFADIKDCYLKLIDPMHLLPIEIMNETIGYYYIQEEEINPLSGILTSTVYYNKYDDYSKQTSILDSIADTIVASFDRQFLEKNMKFKKLIVEALNYFKLNNRKVKFQFIPKEYIIEFKVNEDENGHGVSIIEPSLFYAKLYLMLLLFKIMTIITNSNDTKVNYIRQSGIEQNVANKIQEIARKKQQRQLTLQDLFSYTTLINKVGQGSEMYIPVGKSNERGIETEILAGQDVQMNNELMEMLKKAYISGTGVPDVLLNYLHEAEFAKTIELANTRFQGRVVSFQLDFNEQITELYKTIMKYSTTISDSIIDSFEFNFVQPKYSNSTITNELLNNHTSIQDYLVTLFFGQDAVDDPENAGAIKKFKRLLAEQRLPMLNFDELNKIYEQSKVSGTEESLDPDKSANDSE